MVAARRRRGSEYGSTGAKQQQNRSSTDTPSEHRWRHYDSGSNAEQIRGERKNTLPQQGWRENETKQLTPTTTRRQGASKKWQRRCRKFRSNTDDRSNSEQRRSTVKRKHMRTKEKRNRGFGFLEIFEFSQEERENQQENESRRKEFESFGFLEFSWMDSQKWRRSF